MRPGGLGLAHRQNIISDIIALSPHRERTDGGTEIAVMLCEKDNLAGAPEPPSSPPPLRLLPVRTERASKRRGRKPKAADEGREAEDDSNDPRPIAAAAAMEAEEGDDLSFFVTIFSYVFPMTGAGKRERREREQENYIEEKEEE